MLCAFQLLKSFNTFSGLFGFGENCDDIDYVLDTFGDYKKLANESKKFGNFSEESEVRALAIMNISRLSEKG